MKILVTGGAGYIGALTSQRLIDEGYSVVVYDNLSTGHRNSVPENAFFVLGDVRDRDLFLRVLKDQKISAVIHFAAKLQVLESVVSPSEYYETNVLGGLYVAQSCLKAGVKNLIFSSTAAVYGNPVGSVAREEMVPAPVSPYGRSKLMVEEILRDFDHAYGLRSLSLRYFNVAGASHDLRFGQKTKANHLIKVTAEVAHRKRDKVEVYGTDYTTPDGTGVRDYIHVEDLASAHILALKKLQEGYQTDVMNCGYGRGHSVKQVIQCMNKVAGFEIPTHLAPRRAGDAESIIADNSKIKSALSWKPLYDDLEQICKSAYEWERAGLP